MNSAIKARMLGDKVAVKLDEAEKVSEGGIHLPENVRDKKEICNATVVAVGPGALEFHDGRWTHKPMALTDGMRVVIDKYGRHNTTIAGEELVVITEVDVLAVLPSEK